MNYGILILVLFPVVAGVIGYILGRKNEKNRNDWVDIAVFVQIVLLVCLVVEYIKGWSMEFSIGLLFGTGFSLVADPVRIVLCTLVTMVFFVVSQYMKESLKKERDLNVFYLLFLTMLGTTCGGVLSNNFFNFSMFMMLNYIMLIPMLMQRQDKNTLKNVKTYSVFSAISFGFVSIGLFLIMSDIRSVEYDYLYIAAKGGLNAITIIGGILAMIGFGMWSGLFPIQQQVTRASSVGLMEVSVITTTLLSKLGILGMFILVRTMFHGNRLIGKVVLIWAILTVVWGLFIALISTDIRKILMGINTGVNGIISVCVSVVLLNDASSGYPIRGVLYMIVSSSVALLVLYMVTLELVRKVRTYEIKGLIAEGKGHKILMVVSFVACATLIGCPGTVGFLANSILLKSLLTIVKWKWLLVFYVVQWAFYITAVARVYMKLFVSKKDETMHVLASPEELEKLNQSKEPSDPKNAFRFGEILLVILCTVQIIIGILPGLTVGKLSDSIDAAFLMNPLADGIKHYTLDVLMIFLIAAFLGFIVYLNLVHGIFLRAVRNRKNKQLQKDIIKK